MGRDLADRIHRKRTFAGRVELKRMKKIEMSLLTWPSVFTSPNFMNLVNAAKVDIRRCTVYPIDGTPETELDISGSHISFCHI